MMKGTCHFAILGLVLDCQDQKAYDTGNHRVTADNGFIGWLSGIPVEAERIARIT
jgi:hypothetical protein